MACHYTIKGSEDEQNKMIIFLQRIVIKLFCDPSYEESSNAIFIVVHRMDK